MINTNLRRQIKRVGMKNFVECYFILKNENSTINELPQNLKTENSRKTVLSAGKRIFRDMNELEALHIISESKKEIEIANKAKELLNSQSMKCECGGIYLVSEVTIHTCNKCKNEVLVDFVRIKG